MTEIKKIKINLPKKSNIQILPKQSKILKVCDLFAGTGAFSLAFKNVLRNNVDIVFANDILEHSMNIYKNNIHINNHFVLEDIHNIDVDSIPDFDLLTGGFPCQPFSIAGQKLGFEDPRSNVFWKIMEIINKKQPQFILLENVSNLLNHDHGKTFKIIYDNITNNNYNIIYKILDTCKITGIPQHRERIYIFCYKKDSPKNMNSSINQNAFHNLLDFPEIKQQHISDFLQKESADVDLTKYYYTDKSIIYPKLIQHILKKDTIYQYRRTYVRENKSNVVPTLTANMASGGHNIGMLLDSKGIRKLTPRECFNFQGFPDNYNINGISDNKLYQLAGNAVTYKIIEMIATKLFNILYS